MYGKEILDKILIYQFCAVDLNLFLDNFPNSKDASEDYSKVSARLTSLIHEYEKDYGPLTNFGSSFVENPEAWTEQPWPWENYE